MIFSPLCEKILESPNTYGTRTMSIDTIIIHCYVGQFKLENGLACFSKKGYKYSCNYCIDKDGRIGGVLREEKASICSSSKKADNRGITIECACNVLPPYKVTDKCFNSIIILVADICKRNNIKSIKWSFDKQDRINHRNGINLQVHRDYNTKKSCPGNMLYESMPRICNLVNNILGTSESVVAGIGLGIQKHEKLGSINFNQLDYSLVYDYNFYKKTYPDLAKNGLKTKEQYFFHFVTIGLKECRQGNESFNVISYMNKNRDLVEIFGNDFKWYYAHYILAGKKENRKCK